jgi:HPt (histidine-containing phosphotransfer) domain-containing protein
MAERVLDEDTLRELLGAMGDDMLSVLVSTYVDEVAKDLEATSSALQTGNADLLRAHAHRIKSGSLSLGAAGVATIAGRMETCGKGGDIAGAVPWMDPLREAVRGFVPAVEAWIEAHR